MRGSELAEDPFATGTDDRPDRPRPGAATYVAFSIHRGTRLITLPFFLAMVALIWGLPGDLDGWTAVGLVAASGLIWLPTTVWMIHARFLRPMQDPRGLLLTTGEVLDRAALRSLYRARMVELVILSTALLGTAVGFVARFGTLGIPVLVLVLLFLGWTGWLLVGQDRYAEAHVRMASGDAEGALRALDAARRGTVGGRGSDALETLAAQAWARLGDPEVALAHLDGVRHPRRVHADVVRALVLLGRDVPAPHDLLTETADQPARAVALDQLRALDAVHRGDPDTALFILERWEEARTWLPWMQRSTLDLIAAAAWRQRGEPERARQAVRRADVALTDRAGLAGTWPRWWALLEGLEGEQGR